MKQKASHKINKKLHHENIYGMLFSMSYSWFISSNKYFKHMYLQSMLWLIQLSSCLIFLYFPSQSGLPEPIRSHFMLPRNFSQWKKFVLDRVPILRWLYQYVITLLFGDVISGITVGIMHIPQGNLRVVLSVFLCFFLSRNKGSDFNVTYFYRVN